MNYFYVEKGCESYKKGREILSKLSHFILVESEEVFIKILKEKNLSFTEEKNYYFIGIKRGKFLKEYHLDKGFKAIHEELYLSYENNCPMNCLYCYLREYYQDGAVRFYVNFEDMFLELDRVKDKTISCGIVNDSLAIEYLTGALSDILNYFSKRSDLTLEIRSKHTYIKTLLERAPLENIEIAFTFSPSEVVQRYELKTATFEKRLECAMALQKHGYKIGLRFDPLIYCDNFKEVYLEMVDRIFTTLDLTLISNIGIGTLRYRKGLKNEVLKEHPTDLFFKNFVIGVDGKERYFKPIRIQMYRTLVNKIREFGNFEIYLGMESEYIWQAVLK